MTRSPSISPPGSPLADGERSLVNAADSQSGLVAGRDLTLGLAAENIWGQSEELEEVRGQRNRALGRMADASASGKQMLVDTLAANQANERLRRQLTEGQFDHQKVILEHTLKAFGENLQASLSEARMLSRSGASPEGLMRNHHGQNQMIMSSATTALSAVGDTYNQQYDFLDTARANRAADASLMLDMIERNMKIEEMLLQSVSTEFQKECEFKFHTIRAAIEFVQKVQEEMNKNSDMMEREKDNESLRQRQKFQEEAAKERVMKELNMSQEAARRAADLLTQKETQAHRVKMEEMAIQKSRDRMDYERRTKRYFSIWGFLFG